MSLQSKFILAVVLVLSLSWGLMTFSACRLQNRLVLGQAEQQARMLSRQILLTRQWVADHQGLFLVENAATRANTYLDQPTLVASGGITLVKRNPAMVTRELSAYAASTGMAWFRVTSARPVNPDNAPDAFERESLALFAAGQAEHLALDRDSSGRVLRYAAPLVTETNCLDCHGRHGYHAGDTRGALSLTIPIAWADRLIGANNRAILLFGLLSVLAAAGFMALLFSRLVARPLQRLSSAMAAFPVDGESPPPALPAGRDEIGRLNASFSGLCARLEASQQALTATHEQAFRAEKLAALGQLTAGIAHEVNNPLAGMLNCVRAMEEEPDNRDLHRRYLPLLRQGLRRIEATMRRLLGYGRMEPLHLQPTEVDAVIADCLELLGHRLGGIDLDLDLRCPRPLPLDREALKQIVMNIALNGIQAMPGGGRLTITSREQGDGVVLTVGDSGTGMDAAVRARLFEPFFTTKEAGRGTGLGLAVTLSLVQRLGGRIEVASQPGHGSVFTVTLPAGRNQAAAAAHPSRGVS